MPDMHIVSYGDSILIMIHIFNDHMIMTLGLINSMHAHTFYIQLLKVHAHTISRIHFNCRTLKTFCHMQL